MAIDGKERNAAHSSVPVMSSGCVQRVHHGNNLLLLLGLRVASINNIHLDIEIS